MKARLRADGLNGHRARALERARKIDRGELLEKEVALNFADPLDMASVLTAQRVRLFTMVRRERLSITGLAAALNRDPKSVRRDVMKLEEVGVVRTYFEVNPGHGRVKLVAPAAEQIELTTVI